MGNRRGDREEMEGREDGGTGRQGDKETENFEREALNL